MTVQVVKWECIFEINIIGVVVVVEVDGRDSMELGIKDIDKNIEDIVDFSHNVFSILVSKIGFGVEMAKVGKEWVCSNYFEIGVHNLKSLN